VTDLGFVEVGDLETVSRPIDFLGINYYTRLVVGSGAFPGTAAVEFETAPGVRTANGWPVAPGGLEEVLLRVQHDYGDIPLYVTENGSAWTDQVVGGEVDDPERTAYLASHLRACQSAMAAGVPLRGYFAWSLLDNFEWAEGYAMRFGLVHVDYETQLRTIKTSGRWYADFIDAQRTSY
jgi:beta-glucosidase